MPGIVGGLGGNFASCSSICFSSFSAHRRRVGSFDRLKCPELARLFEIIRRWRWGLSLPRIGRAQFHPLYEIGNDSVAQLWLLGRHSQIAFAPDGLDQQLFRESPGTTAEPVSPPRREASRESS